MTNEVIPQRKPRVFYGYWLIVVTFTFLVLCIGCGSFAFSLFVRPLEASFGWGRGEVMAGFTIFFVTMGIASPVVGRFVDRYGARLVIPVGAVVMGLGFALVSRMSDLWLFYVSYVIIGLGGAGMGQVPSSAIISNWFKKRRGTAIGLMSAGVGAGGFLIAPLVAWLIPEFGWRTAYFSMAVIIWVVAIPLSLLVVRTRPSEMGLYPDGTTTPPELAAGAQGRAAEVQSFTLKQAARTSTFWLIAVSYFFGCFSSMGLTQAPVPFLEDIGYPTQMAAAAIGMMGVGSAVGKAVFGWLCDKMHPKKAWAIGQAMEACAALILININADSPVIFIWVFALLLGLGMGAWLPTLSMLTSTNFGLLFYGAVFGAVNMAQSAGTATGPFFAGLMYDATGTYYWVFVTFASLFAVGIPTVLLVKRPKSPAA
ncbi:MAG: MFS transporter [Dehalococcoidia bacterium]|jgi:MFS family permease|nr:MFS transporter [Dehalococcoidia bacterium]